jgi:hypothetical protein
MNMTEKPPHPVTTPLGGVGRAGDGRIPMQECRFPPSTTDPRILADALRQGAALRIGLNKRRLDLVQLHSLLGRSFPQHDIQQEDQLLGPAALCAHWFYHCRRRDRINHAYSPSTFSYLIEQCFALPHGTITADAVLAGMTHCRFSVQWVKLREMYYPTNEFGWAANISNKAYFPDDPSQLARLGYLGNAGAISPIWIEFGEGAT